MTSDFSGTTLSSADLCLDIRLMRAALSLARYAEGSTYPNPPVGCVIARGGEIIGYGSTASGGVPHAETQALDSARALHGEESIRGASMYVTLEPCAHEGKTPPCCVAIARAGIGRVCYAMGDPDPRTNGKGAAFLARSKVDTISGICAREAMVLLAPYCKRVQDGLPFCILKFASSLDGKISASSNPPSSDRSGYARERTMISGLEARALLDDLRRRTDCIMIGARTMRYDNPLLLTDNQSDDYAPIRVLVDGCLTLPLESRLVQSVSRSPLWVLTRASEVASDKGKALKSSGVRLLSVPAIASQGGHARLSLRECLQTLANMGVSSVLCEGGARLGSALCHEGLVDMLILFSASHILGSQGLSMLEGGASGRLDFTSSGYFGDSFFSDMRLGSDRVLIFRTQRSGSARVESERNE